MKISLLSLALLMGLMVGCATQNAQVAKDEQRTPASSDFVRYKDVIDIFKQMQNFRIVKEVPTGCYFLSDFYVKAEPEAYDGISNVFLNQTPDKLKPSKEALEKVFVNLEDELARRGTRSDDEYNDMKTFLYGPHVKLYKQVNKLGGNTAVIDVSAINTCSEYSYKEGKSRNYFCLQLIGRAYQCPNKK